MSKASDRKEKHGSEKQEEVFEKLIDNQKVRELIGRKVRWLREKHDLKQKDLSEIAGKSIQTISALETGMRGPGLETMQRFAAHFGIHTAFLFDAADISEENLEIWYNMAKILSKSKKTKNFEAIRALAAIDAEE